MSRKYKSIEVSLQYIASLIENVETSIGEIDLAKITKFHAMDPPISN